jgi:hypothetical protein
MDLEKHCGTSNCICTHTQGCEKGWILGKFTEDKIVKLPNGKWYRVTANEFRSYDTERRFGVGDNHEPYNGDVYYYGTNKIAPKENICKIIYHPQHPRREIMLRPHERHFLD